MSISTTDLTSTLVDLTTISLRELRSSNAPALTAAVREVIELSLLEPPDEIQEQR